MEIPMVSPTAPLAVYSQVCHSHVAMALTCLGSFARNCRDAFSLTFIEDGSLTDGDAAQLSAAFNGARVYRRPEQDDLVAPLLKNRPHSLEYRAALPYAIKLYDMAAIAAQNGGDFAYVDPDVYFFRPFRQFDRRGMPEDLVMMNEPRDSYAMNFKDRYFSPGRVKLPRGANAGLIFGRAGMFDWDYVEWFAGRPQNRMTYSMLEQTTWAAMAHRLRAFQFDPRQINIPNSARDITDELVAQHYVMHLKKLLKSEDYLQAMKDFVDATGGAESALPIRTVPMQFPSCAEALAYKSILRLGVATGLAHRAYRSSDPASVLIPRLKERIAALGK
jgi:hypothetical protein